MAGVSMNRRNFLKAAAAGTVQPVLRNASGQGQPQGRSDLRQATVLLRPGELPNAEKTAATVLVEEISKRTGIQLRTSTSWPESGAVIAITSEPRVAGWRHTIPAPGTDGASRPDGYRLSVDSTGRSPIVWIAGADARGALFGVGRLLREVDWSQGRLAFASPLDVQSAPAYPIRGHQLGYRAQANSYDAWNPAKFEQYIRELTFFGANSVEGIPFQDERETPVMKFSRREMNRAIGDICHRYGLDYWLWLPAEFDLRDKAARTRLLDRCDELFRDCRDVSGIFFPGGDPGQNPPELVLPFLEDLARRMLPLHPKARIWLSLQWFTPPQIDSVYQYLDREAPPWFAGLIAGPSGPPIVATRQRLAKKYKLRLYPDITHNVRCQYQIRAWDQAYALTLGREAINPRASEYAAIHNRFARFSDGFISYSDGVHDDINKTVWSALAWEPSMAVRDILVEYARVFWHPSIAEDAADSILALEKNWQGPLADNGAVEGTLLGWRELERKAPQLAGDWRWQMCLLRANYDAYIRRRLIHETKLELEANAIMALVEDTNADAAMAQAMKVLNAAVVQPPSPELRARIEDLCERLYRSVGLQTSVGKYHAIGAERGAVLDFVDYPLNNRWWIEDEFRKIRGIEDEAQKRCRLRELAAWEHPGPGSYYDDVGNASKSPHVVTAAMNGASRGEVREPEPTYWWWDQGKSRARLSWQVTMWPAAMVYEGLAEDGTYVVRSCGFGQALLRINGERVEPAIDGKAMGEIKEFPVAPKDLKGGKLVLTWDRPTNEGHLNWRNRSRLAEVWLVRKG